jgi:cell division protein FtsI/penicillin-binding protein 2
VAAGLDSGAITPRTTYYDAGTIELDTFTIHNYDGRGRGTVDMQEVLNQSLNTGVAHIVETMGKDAFRDYFLSFKLGSETGIDLPYEAHGLVENLHSPRDVEYATAAFGQGIAVTPIAATRALAALGNGGHLVTPHIARTIEYTDGTSREIQYPDGEQVISAETSEEISRMLTRVVDDALAGGAVALPNHTVGAKTWWVLRGSLPPLIFWVLPGLRPRIHRFHVYCRSTGSAVRVRDTHRSVHGVDPVSPELLRDTARSLVIFSCRQCSNDS